ncbi:MAG: hypothetical protein WEE64_11800 [Dehalococcoidia bacterium]
MISKNGRNDGLKVMTAEEGRKLLDRQARRYLGMSGKEFIRKWHAGEFEDPDQPDVMRVAMLLPLGA